MINAFNARRNCLYYDIKPRFEVIKAGDIMLSNAYAIYFDVFNDRKTLVFTEVDPNNYIDINGKMFRYSDINKNPDRIAVLIDNENTCKAIEELP